MRRIAVLGALLGLAAGPTVGAAARAEPASPPPSTPRPPASGAPAAAAPVTAPSPPAAPSVAAPAASPSPASASPRPAPPLSTKPVVRAPAPPSRATPARPGVTAAKVSPGARPAAPGKGTPARPVRGAVASIAATGAARSRAPDTGTRRGIAGGPTADDVAFGAESAELRAMREAERELFPPAMPSVGAPWPTDLPSPMWSSEDAPRVHASGLPPAPPTTAPPLAEGGKDLGWLAGLTMPELPVRWDARVVRYLEFFKSDPRGRALLSYWLKRSGRYRDTLRRGLRKRGLPEDLVWVSMAESGFEPTIKSPAGAAGLWQFMPEAARLYGLRVDRWMDERMSVNASTEAATDFLADLHRRFARWELALAAYNMGYAGVSQSVRKYNTNDFWALSRFEGALPWETTLYVPKILAVAVVAKNLAVFGYADLAVDAAIESDAVQVPPAVAFATVASAAGCTAKELEALNPELRAGRTPPASPEAPGALFTVRVPQGKGTLTAQNLASRAPKDASAVDRYVVRFGESLEQICAARKLPVAKVQELNGLAHGEVVRGGAVLLLPKGATPTASAEEAERPNVVVPADVFVYPDRRRVFYRVLPGDTLRDIAVAFHVTVDELRRWNDVDPAARLQEGMTLQVFAPQDAELGKAVTLSESEVNVLPVGSDEFFAYWEGLKHRKRLVVTAKVGDTLESIGRRYGMPVASMERINRRGRRDTLTEGDTVVVYVPEVAAHR